jgi:hypothetical protein
MQKVVGSSPIIRFAEPAGNGGFLCAEKELSPREALPKSGSCQVSRGWRLDRPAAGRSPRTREAWVAQSRNEDAQTA